MATYAPELHQEAPRLHVVPGLAADGPVPTPTPAPDLSRQRAIEELLTNRPLAPFAGLMVEVSDAYGVDWHLLPIIGFLESSGGLNACGGNAWGWGSCVLRPIETFQEGIDVVAGTLSAPPYTGLGPEGVLCMWVAGHGCYGEQALTYQAKAMVLWAQLDRLREASR